MGILPILDTTYPALILQAVRLAIHHGAVGIARSLGMLGVPVHAVVEDSYTPLAASRYLTKIFVWKSWPAGREAFISAMSTLGAKIGRPAILIPMDDLSADFGRGKYADALSRWFLFPQLPRDLPRQLSNKASLYSLCAPNWRFRVREASYTRVDDVREFADSSAFPIVMKPAEQWSLVSEARYTPYRHSKTNLRGPVRTL